MKTVVPLPGNDQIIVLQALIGLGKAEYQSYLLRPRLEVISPGEGMTLVHVSDVVPCKPKIHLVV